MQRGDGSVIPNVMETCRSDELVVAMDGQGRLNVKGMTPREADQLSVTGNPFVGRADIAMVREGAEIPHGRSSFHDILGGSLAVLGDGRDGNGRRVGAVQFEASGRVPRFGGDGAKVGDGGGGLDERGEIDGGLGDMCERRGDAL